MLSQFKKKLKMGERKAFDQAEQEAAKKPLDTSDSHEDELKKNIESKLKKYRPLQRDSNFLGPGMHH